MKTSRVVAVVGVGVVLFIFLVVLLLPKSNAPTRRLLNVSVDTNGVARLGGVPLPGTNIRNAVVNGLGDLGLKAGFVEAGVYTNETQMSNSLETLNSMRRAGLIPVSADSAPSPFE